MEKPSQCKNCQSPLDGPFCSQCGQPTISERLTVRHFFQFLWQVLTNIKRGLWFTLGQLFTRPGKVVLEYIGGRTRPYYHPLRLAFLMGTISVLIFVAFGTFESTQSAYQEMLTPNADAEAQAMQARVQEGMKPFMNLIPILIIPFYALVSRWFYRKKELNFAEHMVLHAYNYGLITVISLPFIPLYTTLIPVTLSPLVSWTIGALCLAFMFRGVFRDTFWLGMLKGMVVMVFGYLLFFMVFILLGILIAIPIVFITRG